jgi:tetratricopeptide (TPR) repeat protein
LNNFRTYKLIKLLTLQIIKLKEKKKESINIEKNHLFDLSNRQAKQSMSNSDLTSGVSTVNKKAKTLIALGRSYLRKNRIDKAKKVFRKLAEIKRQKGQAYRGMGFCYLKEARYEKAKEMFRDAAAINYNNAWAHYGLSMCLQKTGKHREASAEFYIAKRLFSLSIKKNSLKESCYIGLGLCYEYESKYKEAGKQYIKALKIDPYNDKAYCRLGWVRKNQARFDLAKMLFRKAIQINNRNASAYSGLGRCYRHESNYKKAKEMYQKSIEVDPNNEWAYYGLGMCYREKDKNYEKAKKMFEKTLKLNPGNGWACTQLDWVYKKIGEYQKIDKFYKTAIRLNPRFDILYGGLAQFYREQELFSLARKYSDKLSRLTSTYYQPQVQQNYHKLRDILFEHGIKLVCVQYPMRKIDPLKRVFNSDKDIIFVDNEKKFKTAVAKHGYDKYFIDSFGGDFGHCTTAGNRLLAENIAKAIVDNYFDKSRHTILN